MLLINHRINTIKQLQEVPLENGAEVDVRYHDNDLILHHDPFEHHTSQPLKLEFFLRHWKHAGPLILNIKTEGVEQRCIDLMKQYKVKSWFFLDLSMPYFIKYANKASEEPAVDFSFQNLAVRYSEFEPEQYALSFQKKADWVWVDCFAKMPLVKKTYDQFKAAGFKICIVSPELQGHDLSLIASFKSDLASLGTVDAVCTKRPDLWKERP